MSHATSTHGNQVDSRLFMVGSQTTSLTFGLSFFHNLSYRCPNGSCKPISDMYASIAFRWYKELFNAKCFNLYNHSLKVREPTGTPTPTMGAHLGVWVFILTFSLKAKVVTLWIKLPIWLLTTKSWKSLWFPYVQVAYHISLKIFWQGLQLASNLNLIVGLHAKLWVSKVAGILI